MLVNATDFRNDFSKYLEIAQTVDIIIVRHGTYIARVSGTKAEKYKMLEKIVGSVKYEGDPEEIFRRRLDEL
jgi:prevent-host-death family protein